MPSEARDLTQIVLLAILHAIVVVVFIWDIWMMGAGHADDTVSSILRNWSQRYPELLIPVGYLLCHLFGR